MGRHTERAIGHPGGTDRGTMPQAMLYAAVEQAPSSEVTEEEVITRYYARFDEQFFRVCDKELAKINTFFSGKLCFGYYLYLFLVVE